MRANHNSDIGKVSADTLPASTETASSHPDAEIIGLRITGVQALRIRWARRFRSTAPPIQSADVLMRFYAYRIQAEIYGELDDETRKLLTRARTAVAKGKSPLPRSMGRLTLNVLLSFAQFEREVTAERIRDKFSASRRKGIFMGGCPPLGYDAKDRKLIINVSEAETVRWIFNRYIELGTVSALRSDLEQKGIRTKAWQTVGGKQKGGGPWYIEPLRHILRNRVYVGDAVHKDSAYPGLHEPLLSHELFDAVQRKLNANRSLSNARKSFGTKRF